MAANVDMYYNIVLRPYDRDPTLRIDDNNNLYRLGGNSRVWRKVGTNRGKKWRDLQGVAANKLGQLRHYDMVSAVIQEACRKAGDSNAQVKFKSQIQQMKEPFRDTFELARNTLGLSPTASAEDKLRGAQIAFESRRIYGNLENPNKRPVGNANLTYSQLLKMVPQAIKIAETDHKAIESGVAIANNAIMMRNKQHGFMLFIDKEYRARGFWGTVSAITMLSAKSGIIRCAIKEAATQFPKNNSTNREKAAKYLEVENKNIASTFSKDPKAPIVPVVTSMFTPQLSAIVMPLKDSSLDKVIKQLSYDQVKNISKQMLCIAEWLRSQNLIHADIKAGNLLLEGNTLCLADMATIRDMANKEDVAKHLGSGTGTHMSYIDFLQLSQTNDHDARVKIFERIDDFAWAVTLFMLVTGQRPYDVHQPDMSIPLGRLLFCMPSKHYKSEIVKDMNPEGQKLFAALLVQEPEQRMSMAQATEIILANDHIFDKVVDEVFDGLKVEDLTLELSPVR